MFLAILARTFRLVRRSWLRVLAVQLAAFVVLAAVWALLGMLATGSRGLQDAIAFVLVGVVLSTLLQGWALLAAVRAARHGTSVGRSLQTGFGPPLRLWLVQLLLGIVLALVAGVVAETAAVAVAIAVTVPVVLAIGALAREQPRSALGALWTLGMLRMHRNLGAYAALVLLVAALAAASYLLVQLPLYVLSESVGEVTTPEELVDLARDAAVAFGIGLLLAAMPWMLVMPAFVVATYELVAGIDAIEDDFDDDDEPIGDLPELSPAVAALISANEPPARRLRIPPRAARPGRVPGPGVLNVAGVDLPGGRPARPVDAAVVELVVGDGDAGAGPSSDQLWIATRAAPDSATRWKQLAAGFSETGLWPLLLPPAPGGVTDDAEWFNESARRHQLDVRSPADALRERLAESLSGGSPLSSTDLIAASDVAQGRLGSGSGRRTDALAAALDQVGASRLALAPGRRPADVLHALAWPGADAAGIPSAELAEIVASWEERYGALLVSLDEHSLLLAVLRPPATEQEAISLLAELHATCPDEAVEWGDDARGAAQLVDAPVWRLSWT